MTPTRGPRCGSRSALPPPPPPRGRWLSGAVSRQAKDEIYPCPPALLVIGRADDRWLATWSKADAVISHPIDSVALARELAVLMRARAASPGTAQAITAQ